MEAIKYFDGVKVVFTFTRGERWVSIQVGANSFYPDNYITKNGRTQWKKLQDKFGMRVGTILGEHIEDIKAVVKQFKDGNYKE